MMHETNPYDPPSEDRTVADRLTADDSKSDYLGGFPLASALGIIGGLLISWIWTFLPTSPYDLILGALATPILFAVVLLIQFASDRRVRWSGIKLVRNGLLGMVLAVLAVALFFPVCTGAVVLLDPVPDARLLAKCLGFVALTLAFTGCTIFASRAGASLVVGSAENRDRSSMGNRT